MAYAFIRGKDYKVECPISFDIDLQQILGYILLSQFVFYIAYKIYERIYYTFVPRANPVIVEHSSKVLFYVFSVAGFYWTL